MMNVENSSVAILGAFEFFQDASFLLVMTMTVLVLMFMQRNKEWRAKATWVLFLFVHAVIFYGCVFVVREGIVSVLNSQVIFTNWSSVLRLHGYIVMAVVLFTMRGMIRGKNGKT